MIAQPLPSLIVRYVDAWNEPDPTRRCARLASLYEADGQIVTHSGAFTGMDAIAAHVGQVHEEFIAQGRYRFASGGAGRHHDCVLFRWEMRESGTDELADAGMNLFLISAAGLIADDYQFVLGADSSIGSAGEGPGLTRAGGCAQGRRPARRSHGTSTSLTDVPMTNSYVPDDPLLSLSRRERRRWAQAERRALREHEAWQLAKLRNLAADGGRLTALAYPDSGGYAAPAEFIIDGKRIRAVHVHRRTLSDLTKALADRPAIPLLAASRYGRCWVLTFDLAAAPLVVLTDRLAILPGRSGGSAWPAKRPRQPTANADPAKMRKPVQ